MSNELLSPNFWSINQLFKYRYCVPVYQRPYSWQNAEINSLLSDIWDSYEEYNNLDADDKHIASLYVGNIILHKKGFELYDIIDGQQRITTFSIVLLSLYGRLYELGVDPNDRILIKIQQALWKLDNEEKPIRSQRIIELGSVEKEILQRFFDEAFDVPKGLTKYVDKYECASPFEENVKNNYLKSYFFVCNKFVNDTNELREVLQLANYILSKVFLIAIINEDSEFKAFTIFESINSKGKKLEDIDLIKTRIFSNLSPADYSSYLSKWGTLIIKTGDRLYAYLKVFIKANIKYYSGNVTFNHFKAMDHELCSHFNKKTIGEAYKQLIEEMVEEVDNFIALFDLKVASSIINNNKFKFYYAVYTKIKYEHPWPLFFKCFCEYRKNRLSKEDLISIMIETIKFSITYLTVSGKDSKDAISMFISMFDGIYAKRIVNKDWIIYQINTKMAMTGIRTEDAIASLMSSDVYDKNKQLGAAVLSTYEATYTNNQGVQVSWDEAYSKFTTYGEAYSLDHIMVQTPSINDPNLKYYKLGNNLKLKPGHDFPAELVHDGMKYDNFKSLILHRAGNLRLKGGDGNSSHGNISEESFNTFEKLEKRNETICRFFVLSVIKISETTEKFNPELHVAVQKKKMTGNFDFSMSNLDFTGTKPKSITLSGKTSIISNQKDILISVVKYAFELDYDKLLQLALDKWSPRRRTILSSDKKVLTAPYALVDGKIYIETNLSAADIVFYTVKLLEEFNISKDTVSVYIPE